MEIKKRQYSDEFKAEAIELAERIGVPKTSKELGINQANINRWRNQRNGKFSSGSKSSAELEKENRRLQKENGYLKKINEVLKKSTAIFSNDQF